MNHHHLCLWDYGGMGKLEMVDGVMTLNFRYISMLYWKQSFLCLKHKSQISMFFLICLVYQWIKLYFLVCVASIIEKIALQNHIPRKEQSISIPMLNSTPSPPSLEPHLYFLSWCINPSPRLENQKAVKLHLSFLSPSTSDWFSIPVIPSS